MVYWDDNSNGKDRNAHIRSLVNPSGIVVGRVFSPGTDRKRSPAKTCFIRRLAASLAPALPADNFRAEPIEAMSFPGGFAGLVISSAVLHFARDDGHFMAMLRGTWRVLKPGGLLFCRLASSIGMEDRIRLILPEDERINAGFVAGTPVCRSRIRQNSGACRQGHGVCLLLAA